MASTSDLVIGISSAVLLTMVLTAYFLYSRPDFLSKLGSMIRYSASGRRSKSFQILIPLQPVLDEINNMLQELRDKSHINDLDFVRSIDNRLGRLLELLAKDDFFARNFVLLRQNINTNWALRENAGHEIGVEINRNITRLEEIRSILRVISKLRDSGWPNGSKSTSKIMPADKRRKETEIGTPTEFKFEPNEAALLGGLIDKFYGSWAFRIAGGMLTIAAIFAIAGTAAIGSQIVNIRQDLSTTASNAKQDLANLQTAAQVIIEDQKKNLITTYNDLDKTVQQGKTQVAEAVKKSTEDLNAETKRFVEYTSDLKNKAVTQIVLQLENDIRTKEGEILSQAMKPITAIIGQEIPALKAKTDKLKADTADLINMLADRETELRKTDAGITALKELAQSSHEYADVAKSIKAAGELVRQTLATAEQMKDGVAEFRRAAEKSAIDAKSLSEVVANDLRSIRSSSSEQSKMVGTVQGELNSLARIIINLREDLKIQSQIVDASKTEVARILRVVGGATQAESDIANVRDNVATLSNLVKDIQLTIDNDRRSLDRISPTISEIENLSNDVKFAYYRTASIKLQFDEIDKNKEQINRTFEIIKSKIANFETFLNSKSKILKLDKSATIETERRAMKNESELNQAEWSAIQSNLKNRGFAISKIDGKPGKITRIAIRKYQNSINQHQSGRLSAEQIDKLLETGQPSSGASSERKNDSGH